jgi:hypothetical protein
MNKYTANISLSYLLYEDGENPAKPSYPINVDKRGFTITLNEESGIQAIQKMKNLINEWVKTSNQTMLAEQIKNNDSLTT